MTPRRLLIGAPTRNRHWILPAWRDHILRALDRLDPDEIRFDGFLFVIGNDDRREFDLVKSWPEPVRVLLVDEPARHADVRDWNLNRLALMAALRNTLLGHVRELAPDLFASIDTDILRHPNALAGLIELLDTADETAPGRVWAAGGKAHMVPGGEAVDMPSYAFADAEGTMFSRNNTDAVLEPDVIMGVKLMTPPAYRVGYTFHPSGEDVSWSLAVRDAGGAFVWDGRHTNKHVTDYPWLYLPDPRVGW